MADGSIRINTKIDKKGAEQGLKELKKDADTKVKQLESGVASAGKEVEKLNQKFAQTSQELNDVEQKMDLVGDRVFETYKNFQGGMSESSFDKFILEQIEADTEYKKLISKQEELKNKVNEYKTKLNSAEGNQKQLNSSLKQAKKEQTEINLKLENAKKKTQEVAEKMKNASKHTKKVSVESLGISKGLGGAVKKLAKYGLVLLGFRGIYGMLKSSMSEWLNGNSKEAKQLNADLSNVKNNIASALAPAMQGVLRIFYKILAIVGAVVKAFANINIFARNTAKSTSKTANNSKETSNNLASFDKLDVLSKDTESDSDADISPTNLTSLMAEYEDLANKIKNIFEFIFDPFKRAWETEGQNVIDSIHNAFEGMRDLSVSVGNSFIKIWTNGTVQTTAELFLKIFADILNTIGNISRAWANAWTSNGNGDKIVQSLANAFNNLLYIIESVFKTFEEWTASQSFQNFANAIIEICKTISSWFEKITNKLKEIWENGGKDTFTSLLEFGGKLVEVIAWILEQLSPVIDFVLDVVTPVISAIIDAIGWVIKALTAVIDFILKIFQRKLGRSLGWNKAILC